MAERMTCPEWGTAFSDEEEMRRHMKEHERGSTGKPGDMEGEKPYGEE